MWVGRGGGTTFCGEDGPSVRVKGIGCEFVGFEMGIVIAQV